ncbi:MAG: type II secretion system protein [Patescibacteria group bacterium]
MMFNSIRYRGFTLVELLVVIAIIAILASVVILIINPLELMRRSKDSVRLKDLDNLQQAINVSIQESTTSLVSILCKDSGEYPCAGSSHINSRLTNGSGWVKANLAVQNSVTVPTLPVDPLNNADYHYTYCADDDKWEIDAALESNMLRSKAYSDGGDSPGYYETGSNLNLIAYMGGSCTY